MPQNTMYTFLSLEELGAVRKYINNYYLKIDWDERKGRMDGWMIGWVEKEGMSGCPDEMRYTVTNVPQLNNSNSEVSRGKNLTWQDVIIINFMG